MAAMNRQGKPLKSVKFNLEDVQVEYVRQLALDEDRSFSSVLRRLLTQGIEAERGENRRVA